MGTLMNRVHALPGSTSSNVVARGDYDAEAQAVLTFREFERIMALESSDPTTMRSIPRWAGRPPRPGQRGTGGSQPRQAGDAEALLLDFLPFEERIVRRDGVACSASSIKTERWPISSITARANCGSSMTRGTSVPCASNCPPATVRVRYADLGRPPVTLWEHRDAVRRLRLEGRRSVDEHAIFAAIEEQRRVLMEAQASSKAARRAVARIGAAERANASRRPTGEARDDTEAQVDAAGGGETSGVEFW